MPPFKSLLGQRFRKLLVHSHAGVLDGLHYWICKCDCGRWTLADGKHLGHGKGSCGCLKSEANRRPRKHGLANKPEYTCYYSMLSRCHSSDAKAFPDYGARGIKVCARWRYGNTEKSGFQCFIEDMGLRPSMEHSIGRIDVDGNYIKENCRWETRGEQARNTRRNAFVMLNGERLNVGDALKTLKMSTTKFYYWKNKGMAPQEIIDLFLDGHTAKKTHLLTFRGETKSVTQWGKTLGMDKSTIIQRLNKLGWDVERALGTPLQEQKRGPKRSSSGSS